MASNQTPNYGLNQWSLDDSVVMADFNADNLKLEEALNTITASIPQIRTGTYTGTGEYGAEHPNVLTFDFTPKLVLINCLAEGGEGANGSDHFTLVAVHGTERCVISYWNTSTSTVTLQWGNNALSWYGVSAQKQGNWLNAVYHYIAIG